MEFKKGIHYSPELENAVLGACLLEKDAIGRIYGLIEAEFFYSTYNQEIYRSLKLMYQEGVMIDLLTVIDFLVRKRGVLVMDGFNTDYYVTGLINWVVSAAHLEYHAHIIKSMWMEREVIRITHSGAPEGDIKEKIKAIQDSLNSLQNKVIEHDWVDMTQLMVDLYRHQEEIKKTGGIGKPTGIYSLDKENGGFQDGQLIVVGARPSMGKCLGIGTGVLMFDGTIKLVENILVGDELMGINSKPRKVLSITSGVDDMYEIKQRNGISYIVNSEHILSLKRGKTENCYKHGDLINIKTKDFFKLPISTQKRHKGYMSDAINFNAQPLRIDPYFLGLWIGDGRKSDQRITNEDSEIVDYCEEYAGSIGMKLTKTKKRGTNCWTLSISQKRRNNFGDCIKKRMGELGILGNKKIPEVYLINSIENRLQLLAGIIDTDGHVNKKTGTVEITQKDKNLLLQIKFLCNTLGFRTSFKIKTAKIKSINYSCQVYKMIISGNTQKIPLKINRKRAALRIPKRNALMTSIRITKIETGVYYGFELDGDGLFMLEDCTVTHNSALVSGMAIEMGKKNLVTGIVSLEMSNTEIAARLAAYDADTDFNVVYRGLYKDMDETHRLYSKIGNSTSTLPIWVTDKTRVNISEIRAKAEKLKKLHGLDCLMIDYLQLVTPIGGSYNKNRENEIAEMSRGCKIMAKELNIPVILLCQLNREVTKRKGQERYPQLSDLRESGAIEQDADVVMFLHRDFMAGYEVDENGVSTERQADLVIRKWRNGKSNFKISLDFDPPKMKFSERKNEMFVPISVNNPYETDKNEEMPF